MNKKVLLQQLAQASFNKNEIQVRAVLVKYKLEQDRMLSEVRNNQQELQRKLEESICRELEGIIIIWFGAQAKEYLEETQRV